MEPTESELGRAMNSTSVDEPGREFVDSNVLVYSVDRAQGRKATRAAQLIDELWKRRTGCLSIQVLQEFFVTVTTRLPKSLSVSDATTRVAELAEWRLHSPGSRDLLSAIDLHKKLRISFWDAMI